MPSLSKVVICGAGFLGKHIARQVAQSNVLPLRRVQLSSRKPQRVLDAILSDSRISGERFLSVVPVDVVDRGTLERAFVGASVVVSLVGIMHGTPQDFERIQWRGAESVAICAKDAGSKLIHFSAIGADIESDIPYARTKALAEQAVFNVMPEATVIRPSLVFGPEDDFFNRFARLSRFLPFVPVFGGGKSRFQPVYVGDLARLVEVISQDDTTISQDVAGKIIEAGGPKTYTYRELMQLVLKYTHRRRPILSLPFAVGKLQGTIMEQLPTNLFTITQAQVEQLKSDNVVEQRMPENHVSLQRILSRFSGKPLSSLEEILPTYIH